MHKGGWAAVFLPHLRTADCVKRCILTAARQVVRNEVPVAWPRPQVAYVGPLMHSGQTKGWDTMCERPSAREAMVREEAAGTKVLG